MQLILHGGLTPRTLLSSECLISCQKWEREKSLLDIFKLQRQDRICLSSLVSDFQKMRKETRSSDKIEFV